ncbi:MAG: hypothetical protein AABX32_06195 [Nanoarchaeota archaeon]
MEECQEPRCSAPATKDWNGRKVCADHYDMYREQHESMTREAF